MISKVHPLALLTEGAREQKPRATPAIHGVVMIFGVVGHGGHEMIITFEIHALNVHAPVDEL